MEQGHGWRRKYRSQALVKGFNLATGRHQAEGLRGCVPFAMPSLPGTTEMRLKIVMFVSKHWVY